MRYAGLWPGIDAIVYGNQGRLEYDLRIAPRADPRRIALSFPGARSEMLDARGDLLLTLVGAGHTVKELAPVAYQTIHGRRHAVAANYVMRGDLVSVQLAGYDRRVVYSTYLGGSGMDDGRGIAIDGAGDAYVTGSTSSANFPTVHPFQASLRATPPSGNAFVAKLNAAGSALVYSTYLGGSKGDAGQAIVVDSAGDAYVAGATFSHDFPTQKPLQPNLNEAVTAFATELGSTGQTLVYSTYLGGSSHDAAYGIALGPSGNAYVTGYTDSTDFPTKNPSQGANAGLEDVFVTELSSQASEQPALSVTVEGAGSGTVTGAGISCPGTCTRSYTQGETVTLTATAAPGSAFGGWGGTCAGSGAQCTLTMNEAEEVTATFGEATLDVGTDGQGIGVITSEPAGIDCGYGAHDCTADFPFGTDVVLTESNKPGPSQGFSIFDGWGADCSPSGKRTTCELTMNEDRTADAAFEPGALVTVAVDGPGQVLSRPTGISCGSEAESGQCGFEFAWDGEDFVGSEEHIGPELTLAAATSEDGWHFDHWGQAYPTDPYYWSLGSETCNLGNAGWFGSGASTGYELDTTAVFAQNHGSTIRGEVFGPDGEPVPSASVQACTSDDRCSASFADADGDYHLDDLAAGAYELTADPMSSDLYPGDPASAEVDGSPYDVASADIEVQATPPDPPSGTTITDDDRWQIGDDNGMPAVNDESSYDVGAEAGGSGSVGGESASFGVGAGPGRRGSGGGERAADASTAALVRPRACAGGKAVFSVSALDTATGKRVIRTAGPVSAKHGVYTASFEPMRPAYGIAAATVTVRCSGRQTRRSRFGIVFAPTGFVRDAGSGHPIPAATVTLLRSPSREGRFTAVPNGNGLMSAVSRNNPTRTDRDGAFSWGVLAGYYKIAAAAPGCRGATTGVLSVPPSIAGLVVWLDCGHGSGAASRCLVPDTFRQPLAGARQMITAGRCRVGAIRRAFSNRLPTGAVILQQPAAGKLLHRGAPVSLLVSKGR